MARNVVVALLDPIPDIEVVADVAMGPNIGLLVAAIRPDVVIVYNDLLVRYVNPVLAGLHTALPECAALVLVDPRQPVALPPGRYAGPASFLFTDVAPAVLVDTVRRLAAGERLIDPRLAIAALAGASTKLTIRELEVLGLAADGASVVEIARCLYLSLGTVRNYLSKVIGKTGARNRIDAIRIAREAGWLA